MDLTVVIPTHNRAGILEKTLDGFCRQEDSPSAWELLIVDDGSTDGTAEAVRRCTLRLPIRYAAQPKAGVSKARNLGLRLARGALVLFLDDDVIPGSRLLAEHAGFHRRRPNPACSLLGYVTWNPELKITPFMRWYGESGALFGYARLRDGAVAPPRFLYSCNVSFKTGFLRAVGGFDESLSVLEDHELGFRLARRGMELYFERAATGYHHQTFTFEQACRRLERYGPGLHAFLQTEAGRTMAQRRARPAFRVAEAGVRVAAPLLFPVLRGRIDSERRLPNAIYRLFYWYFASYKSFWSRVTGGTTAEACHRE